MPKTLSVIASTSSQGSQAVKLRQSAPGSSRLATTSTRITGPVSRSSAGHGRQRLHVGKQVCNVGGLHPCIGGIGKGRIEVRSVGRRAFQHGVGEIFGRPRADPVIRVAGNVRRDESAEGRLQFQPAGKLQRLVALRAGLRMA